MRQLLISMFLLLSPVIAVGDRGSFDINVIEFTEKGDDEYKLRFIQLSQPYGYKHKQDEEIVVHLRFKCLVLECLEEENHPTKEKYLVAIDLLKKQISVLKQIKFGIVDRGYAQIKGTEYEYQSNALEIYEGIVCSDYDIFDF